MRITFDELTKRDEFLHIEIMNSLTGDLIKSAMEERAYDIKLLINGIEVEPLFLNRILNNLDEYIKQEAAQMIDDKFEHIRHAINDMDNIIDEVVSDIKEKFRNDIES